MNANQQEMPISFWIDVPPNRSTRGIHRLLNLGKPHLAQITNVDQQTPPIRPANRTAAGHSPRIFQNSLSSSILLATDPSGDFPLLVVDGAFPLAGIGGVLIFALMGALCRRTRFVLEEFSD